MSHAKQVSRSIPSAPIIFAKFLGCGGGGGGPIILLVEKAFYFDYGIRFPSSLVCVPLMEILIPLYHCTYTRCTVKCTGVLSATRKLLLKLKETYVFVSRWLCSLSVAKPT